MGAWVRNCSQTPVRWTDDDRLSGSLLVLFLIDNHLNYLISFDVYEPVLTLRMSLSLD